jgi:hypothetical protein
MENQGQNDSGIKGNVKDNSLEQNGNEVKKQNVEQENGAKDSTPQPSDKNKNLLDENLNLLKELNIYKDTIEAKYYSGDESEKNNPKIISLENSPNTITNIFKKAINLEKLTIKSCPNISFDLIEILPKNLKELSLEKNNFNNSDLEIILKGILSNNESALNNLEYLSFAGNILTRVDLSVLSSKIEFKGLLELNFQKNKIYKFIYNPENFPNLKFINCCKNNFNKSYFSDIKKLGSLESGNGFLFEPDLCKKYYENLKGKLEKNEDGLFRSKYLNITYMPKVQSMEYFKKFCINAGIASNLRKLDLSYNGINCDTFFNFVSQNDGFKNLISLNLNGNELDDTFFEKFDNKKFESLQHLYLNSNKIGNTDIKISYKDNETIDPKYSTEKDKLLIYKLRLIYKFIQENANLNKLTITKNPISEFYSVVPEPNNNADKNEKYIKKNDQKKIVINCLFSLLIKIRDELLVNEEEKGQRKNFNLRFDCRSNVNRNSENYPFSDRPFVYKSK